MTRFYCGVNSIATPVQPVSVAGQVQTTAGYIHYPDIFIQIQSVILFLHSSSRVELSASFGARSNFLTESRVGLMDGVGRQTTGAGQHLSCNGTISEVFTIMGLLTNTKAFSWLEAPSY